MDHLPGQRRTYVGVNKKETVIQKAAQVYNVNVRDFARTVQQLTGMPPVDPAGGKTADPPSDQVVKLEPVYSLYRSYISRARAAQTTYARLDHSDHRFESSGNPLLTSSWQIEEPTVYCRQDDMKNVIDMLLSNDCNDSYISIIRIVGGSGIGKTSFVNLVYSTSIVHEIFDTRVWVHANAKLDVKGLTRVIAESLTGITCGLTELSEIQEAVSEQLAGKCFLLVLDNAGNDDLSFWNSLLVPFGVGAKGSTIIATTLNEVVIVQDIIRSYELKRLSTSNCSLVLQQLAFDGRDYITDPDLASKFKQIITISKCLPLALKALGGLMKVIPLKRLKLDMLRTDSIGADEILSSLRFCYDHLTEHLRHCFEYSALFPKGYIFEKDHLVRLWMSQGFIKPEKGKDEHETGKKYFEELLKRSFFQNSPVLYLTENKYVMHDLFHELAESVSVNKYFREENSNLFCIPENVHHISLVPTEFDIAVDIEQFEELRNSKTFIFVKWSSVKPATSIFHLRNPEMLNNLFVHLKHLRTLDLSYTNIQTVPESISNLSSLRYLGLNRTRITRLPDSLCSLHNLQTLELQGCNFLFELSLYIKKLANLIHLDVWKESGFILMPHGIRQLTGLKTLSTFTVGRDEQHCGLSELGDLINLEGSLCIGGLGNVLNGEDAKKAKLEMKERLRTLALQWFNCDEDQGEDQSAETASKVLQNLLPNSDLEELTIREYSGDRFPSWMGDPSFSKLTTVTLDNCCECNNLPSLGQLPSLKHLSVRMVEGVQCLGREMSGSGSSRGFPSLETLTLCEMSELEEWSELEDEDFPRLNKLCINRCNKLKRLPSFASLEELSVHCCAQLPELPSLVCLKTLKIEGIQNLESLRQFDLPSLKILEISSCYQLLYIEGLSQIAFLEKLKLTRCPKLSFSLNEQFAPMLQVVDIWRGCSLLRNWCPNGFLAITNARQVNRRLVRQKQAAMEVL